MRGAVQMQITTIGLDIAKNVFQVHGIDAKEKVVARKQLRRSQVITFFKALPPCLIGMEACATAHYWARELTKLGHEVRLMPAKDVKAYVKRNKNDAADAEAICEAVRRPTMRFVRIKSAEQQGQLMQHRTRDVLIRQRTQIINALRAHLAELGIVAAQGNAGVNELRAIVTDEQDTRLPIDARASVIVLAAQLEALESVIGAIEKRIKMQHRSSEASQRVEAIPGIGVIEATAIVATVADPTVFRLGRDFAAWIGLVPRQDSTGGKQKLGPISKQGDRYLRRILVVGAIAVLRRAKENPGKYPWPTATRLSAEILHKDPKVTAVIAEEVPGERRFCGGVSLADKGLASFWLDIRITESTNTKDEKAAFIAETFRAMEALLGPLHEESYACA